MAAVNYWLWLTTRKGVGQRGILRLLEYFGTPERVYFALREDLGIRWLPPETNAFFNCVPNPTFSFTGSSAGTSSSVMFRVEKAIRLS